MIKGLILLIMITLSLFSGTVINQNIYEKENSVDIMLSFDTPYKGKVIQKKNNENTILILENATVSEKSTQEINSHVVQSLTLTPYKKQLLIELIGIDAFEVDASKTVDNYGLRLRIKPQLSLEALTPIKESEFKTKKEDDISSSYLKVFLVLAALIAFLYLLKRWLLNRGGDFQGNWLFDKNEEKRKNQIKIKHQRALDVKNRVALISYADKEYLLLLGNNNLLLDTFDASNPASFDTVLSQNEEALSDFIKQKSKKFNNYKQKISD